MCELKKDHVDPRCAWSIWTWPRLKDLITVYTTSSPLHRNEKVNIYHSLWGNPIIQHFGDGEVNSCFLFFSMLCWTLQLQYLPWRLLFMVLFMFDRNLTNRQMLSHKITWNNILWGNSSASQQFDLETKSWISFRLEKVFFSQFFSIWEKHKRSKADNLDRNVFLRPLDSESFQISIWLRVLNGDIFYIKLFRPVNLIDTFLVQRRTWISNWTKGFSWTILRRWNFSDVEVFLQSKQFYEEVIVVVSGGFTRKCAVQDSTSL